MSKFRAIPQPVVAGPVVLPLGDTPSKNGAFYLGLLYLFFVFSHASEFIDTRGNLHLVMLTALLAFAALLFTGNIPRMVATKTGAALTFFTMWLILGLPFSSWKGGSIQGFMQVWWKSYISFFLVGGLIFTFVQMRKAILCMAGATFAVMYLTLKNGMDVGDDRLTLSYGSLGNSNDLASSLLMGLPFLLSVTMDRQRNKIVRVACALGVPLLLATVLRTGSRAGLIAIGALTIFSFIRVSAANKLKLGIVMMCLLAGIPFVLTTQLKQRYGTLLSDKADSEVAESAILSQNARRELLYHSFILTAQHPIFGVGLDQFSNRSAQIWIDKGEQPMWFTSHDIFMLVSSECGIPALIAYIATIVFAYKTLTQVQQRSKDDPSLKPIADTGFAIKLSLIAFVVAGIFSPGAYSIQLPLIAGLAVALERCAEPLFLAAAQQNTLERPSAAYPFSPFAVGASKLTQRALPAPLASAPLPQRRFRSL